MCKQREVLVSKSHRNRGLQIREQERKRAQVLSARGMVLWFRAHIVRNKFRVLYPVFFSPFNPNPSFTLCYVTLTSSCFVLPSLPAPLPSIGFRAEVELWEWGWPRPLTVLHKRSFTSRLNCNNSYFVARNVPTLEATLQLFWLLILRYFDSRGHSIGWCHKTCNATQRTKVLPTRLTTAAHTWWRH